MIAYHYCGTEGFRCILSTKTLWATHFKYLNDAGEIRRGIEIAKEEAISLRDVAKIGIEQFYFDQVVRQLGEKASRHVFVVCFSEEGDLLSQWRAYADDGRGFAIGFDLQRLSERPSPLGMKLSGRVIYNEADLRKSIRDYLLQHAPNATSHPAHDDDDAVTANANNQSWGILSTVARFKHHGFKEERESRIAFVCNLPNEWTSIEATPMSEINGPIYLSSFDRLDEELPAHRKFRVSTRGIVPYLEWKFDADDIAEIRVGPRGNSEQQLSAVRMFLESNGYLHLMDKLVSSEATYC
jgi:hypothetical protein